jgi:hypothetical protein
MVGMERTISVGAQVILRDSHLFGEVIEVRVLYRVKTDGGDIVVVPPNGIDEYIEPPSGTEA